MSAVSTAGADSGVRRNDGCLFPSALANCVATTVCKRARHRSTMSSRRTPGSSLAADVPPIRTPQPSFFNLRTTRP